MNRDLSQMSGEELQGAIQNIMASPAFGQLLGQLQGKSPDAAEKPAMPAITPEMMQKLPQMMSALAPLVGGGGKSEKADGGGKGGDEGEKRKKLLLRLGLPEHVSANAIVQALDLLYSKKELEALIGELIPGETE